MNTLEILNRIQGQLIVSCQALQHEAMYSDQYPIMKHFALAAQDGGAGGIRANTVRDIIAIRQTISIPVIGIIKQTYGDNPVFITPTIRQVADLVKTGCEIIAMDATARPRPDGVSLEALFSNCKNQWPNQVLMADCSTLQEGLRAKQLGFDLVATTLSGYTDYTQDKCLPDMELVKQLADSGCRVIAEGGIHTPQELAQVMEAGAFAAVVGAAITRPMEITKNFINALEVKRK